MTTGPFPNITEEAVEELRSRVGRPVEDEHSFVRIASEDSIRNYALGIGDGNPLWLDREYAQRTRWGSLLAPPSFLYATSRVVSGYVGGLPGVHAMFAGTHWHWFRPIKEGCRITPETRLKDLIIKDTQFAGPAVQQIYETHFHDEEGQLLATADSWCFRTERETARELGKYEKERATQHVYSEEELEAIWQHYCREEVRGANPRLWEDVQVGEELTPVVKGPMSPTTSIAYLLGWGGLYLRAHRFAFEQYRRHPKLGIPNAQNVPEPPERVHWDSDLARRVGVPAAYDYGPERVSWMSHLMTNWIGDDGFLEELYVEIRHHNIMGDTTWCKGRVAAKEVEDGKHLIRCDLWAHNQDDKLSVKGYAVASLPSGQSA
ncbi:MAG: MaoC family dehydratase N-terminal domain-containing protein [Anaerolineae bacterium]